MATSAASPTSGDVTTQPAEQSPHRGHRPGCRCIKKTPAVAAPQPERWVYLATIAKVVDGDTVDAVVDVGFGISHKIRVRLAGVYAPELGTPEGAAARDFTAQWVAEHGPTFWVRTFRDRRERYGRYLATVTPEAEGDGLGAALVAAGHASTAS
ncbi:hypothetical protein ETD86_12890 [Nonomuraea turkmeniaca]|uniref:TNase-like domain-containing protein n=1 Tax=Nonomuraea turkmeniaca TaxID=103838 RepID=A0A5S4FN54_9ACTN|nr:thermonuclease family protein [Nonomuraea turkmeniaca]TMR22059.1 hypothetical protein ETD86_12890 [Nonomuraea turkmeniaca]